MMSDLRSRNGWTIAERSGDRTPDRTQRLLNWAVWDTFAAMGVVRRFAMAGLDEAARKTGRRLRRGGGRGRRNRPGQGRHPHRRRQKAVPGLRGQGGQWHNTVCLANAREGTGRALIGAREWIPVGHIGDLVTSAAMGLPVGLAFRTKGQLAIDILAEAFADGLRLDFVCGDEVYGTCTEVREYLEDHDQPYVLRVPASLRLILDGGITLTCKQAAARLPSRRGGKSAPPGPDPKDTAGTPGHGWPPPRRGTTC